MPKYSKGLAALLFLGLCALNSSCSESPQEPLRLASSPWPGYEPIYLARDLGYIGGNVAKVFELPSSDITMESFRNHSADVATLTLDETLELIHDGVKLRILQILDISNGGDAVLARPEIKTLKDIKGKRISIVNIPLGLYMLNRTLDSAGLNRNDVTVFPMSEAKQELFYRQGKADVIITFEPVKTRLKKLGAHVIFDSSQIPNEIFDILVVHESVYQSRRDGICQLTKAWYQALDYIKNNPEDASKRITRRLEVSQSDFAGMMSGLRLADKDLNHQLLAGNKPGLVKPAEKLAQIMFEEKQLSRKVSIESSLGSLKGCTQ